MKRNNPKYLFIACLVLCSFVISEGAYSMGLRSFVALPVEKGGGVARLSLQRANDADIDTLMTSAAIGLSENQTILFGMPYRLSPAGTNRQGDVSVLYRHIVWKKDRFSGTNRLGLLGGVILPTENDRDNAAQAGFVFTHFNKRNEIDFDVLYQVGFGNRDDSGRYDISWQYRLSPEKRPDWGLSKELNSVLELNGRWQEGVGVTHQVTAGLQWIHPKVVLEGGITKDISNNHEWRYLLSTRFHF